MARIVDDVDERSWKERKIKKKYWPFYFSHIYACEKLIFATELDDGGNSVPWPLLQFGNIPNIDTIWIMDNKREYREKIMA